MVAHWIVDTGVVATATVAVFGVTFAVTKVLQGAWKMFKRGVAEATQPAHDTLVGHLEEVRHLVKYHLGPNDGTKPMWVRVIDLEKAHNIEDNSVIPSKIEMPAGVPGPVGPAGPVGPIGPVGPRGI